MTSCYYQFDFIAFGPSPPFLYDRIKILLLLLLLSLCFKLVVCLVVMNVYEINTVPCCYLSV